jgi:hypothetical protein
MTTLRKLPMMAPKTNAITRETRIKDTLAPWRGMERC